jgi:hypothetical protein
MPISQAVVTSPTTPRLIESTAAMNVSAVMSSAVAAWRQRCSR